MKHITLRNFTVVCISLTIFFKIGHAYTLADISKESAKCIDCHKKASPSIYEQMGCK